MNIKLKNKKFKFKNLLWIMVEMKTYLTEIILLLEKDKILDKTRI